VVAWIAAQTPKDAAVRTATPRGAAIVKILRVTLNALDRLNAARLRRRGRESARGREFWVIARSRKI
jgi:hypothetical protein